MTHLRHSWTALGDEHREALARKIGGEIGRRSAESTNWQRCERCGIERFGGDHKDDFVFDPVSHQPIPCAPPLAPDEIATVEQAATDAEARYQARERARRAAAHAPDGRRFEKVSLPAAATAPNAFDPGAIAEIEAANEQGRRSAVQELDAAIARAEAERLNPPELYRAGDGPPADVRGLEGIPDTRPIANTASIDRMIKAPGAWWNQPEPPPDLEGVAQRMHAMGATPSSAPIRQPLTIAGTFRVYFNRHQAAPLVWCVATGHLEIAVAEVIITSTFGTRTIYRPKATPDCEDGLPSAWLEVDGVLRIDPNSSTARIG